MCGVWEGGGGRGGAQIQGPGAQKPLSQDVTSKPQPGLTLQLPVSTSGLVQLGVTSVGSVLTTLALSAIPLPTALVTSCSLFPCSLSAPQSGNAFRIFPVRQ